MGHQLSWLWHEYQAIQKEHNVIIPPKSVLRPARLLAGLGWYVITEYIDRDHLMVRLSGTKIDDVFGRNVTGMNTLDLLSVDDLDALKNYSETIINDLVGGCSKRVIFDRDFMPYLLHGMSLPLADGNGRARYIVTAMLLERDREIDGNASPETIERIKRHIDYEFFNIGAEKDHIAMVDVDERLDQLKPSKLQWRDGRNFRAGN